MKPFLKLALLLCAGAVSAQEQPKWLEGKWDVRYRDTSLGEIHGTAAVDIHNDGFVFISYTLTDPRDGSVHDLTAFHIRVEDNTVTMELPPGGPVAALDAEGTPAASTATGGAAPGSISVPGGARLEAVLGGKKAEAAVTPNSALLSTRLRLTRDGDRLTGEWEVTRGPAGFAGARCGERGEITEDLPPPAGKVRTQVMRGTETWESARIVVENAQRTEWRAPRAGAAVAGTAMVSLRGKNLPEPRRREIRFADPYLIPDNAALSSPVPVGVASRAVPGIKSFTLRDRETGQEAAGTWIFDWPALTAKEIRFTRRSAGGAYETAGVLYSGELFYLEVEAPSPPQPGDLRLYALESDAPEPVFVHLRRDTAQRSLFRAGPFLVLAMGEPAGPGAVEPPPLQTNQTTITAPADGRAYIVRASEGVTLQASPAHVLTGEPMAAAFIEVKADHSGDGPYQRALRQAEELRKRYPDAERYDVTRFTPLSGSRRTHITVQDHAALLLLHSELLRNLGNLRRQFTRELSASERRALAGSLIAAATQRVDLPIFYCDVVAPAGGGRMRLNSALYEPNLREAFGTDTAARDAYVDAAVTEAGRRLSEQAAAGAAHIATGDLSRPGTLLPAIKSGYSAAAATVMQRLVRRARPDRGEPALPRWVVDETGRAAVRGVPDLLGAVAADEELADFQWGALQIMALPAGIYTGVLGAAGMLTRGALALGTAGDLLMAAGATHNLVRLDAARDLRDAALSSAPVAGYDTYRAARDEIIARSLTAAVDVPLTLLGAASLAGQLTRAGVRPVPQAARSAVRGAVEGGVESLSGTQRAQFTLVLDSAARKAAAGGLDSLSTLERAALRANFPDGIPAAAARELKIPPGHPDFVISVGDRTLAGAAGPLPPASAPPAAAALPRGAPAHPVLRKAFDEALNSARTGSPEARARLARLERAAAAWEKLPGQEQGRVTEALETLKRLRRENPGGTLDEADALEYLNFHAPREAWSGAGGHRPVLPEELAAEYMQLRGQPVAPEALARAAGISEPNAEAAVLLAERRLPLPGTAEHAAAPPRIDAPGAETAATPPAAILPPPNAREAEISANLRRMGLSAAQADVAAVVPGARPGNAGTGAAHAAMMHGVPARRVQDALGLSPQELRSAMDDYLRRFDPAGASERGQLLDRWFGEGDTVLSPRRVSTPSTEPNLPRGLAEPAAPPASAHAEAVAALERMGVPRAETEMLRPEDIFPRTGGRDARESAAALARRMNVPAPRAARALGISETEYAGLLDRTEAAARPSLTASQRATAVAAELRADGVTRPFSRVLEARSQQVDAALRDLGLPGGDPSLLRAGVEPESAVAGQALENGVRPADIAARRGLNPERVSELEDDFLRNARGLNDDAARARHRTAILERRPAGPESPPVLAVQDEVATALQRVGVDPVTAGERAAKLADLAGRDAHAAIIGGAWQSRVPPAALRSQFGYTDSQIARGLDAFLASPVIGMKNPAARAAYIARYGFGPQGGAVDAAAVRLLLDGPHAPPPPLRAVSARPPASVRPEPVPNVTSQARSLDEMFGPAAPPRGPRPGEKLPNGAWRANAAAVEIRPGTPARLNPDLRYNWLIDEQGRFIAAPEQYILENGRPLKDADGEPLRMGHPAMIAGGRARIAGELRWNESTGWTLDNLSGRYSLGRPELTPAHLDRAADILEQAGMRVQRAFYKPE